LSRRQRRSAASGDKILEYYNAFVKDKKRVKVEWAADVTAEDVIHLETTSAVYSSYFTLYTDKGETGGLLGGGGFTKTHAKVSFTYKKNANSGDLDILVHVAGLTPQGVERYSGEWPADDPDEVAEPEPTKEEGEGEGDKKEDDKAEEDKAGEGEEKKAEGQE